MNDITEMEEQHHGICCGLFLDVRTTANRAELKVAKTKNRSFGNKLFIKSTFSLMFVCVCGTSMPSLCFYVRSSNDNGVKKEVKDLLLMFMYWTSFINLLAYLSVGCIWICISYVRNAEISLHCMGIMYEFKNCIPILQWCILLQPHAASQEIIEMNMIFLKRMNRI